MSIRVMLADDHRMFREALGSQLRAEPDMDIVAEASSGAETLSRVKEVLVDVLVLDIGLPDMNGIEIARKVLDRHAKIRIVALSGYADRLYVQEMLKAGASAYVVKSSGTQELLSAIRAVFSGHTFLSPEVTDLMVTASNGRGQSIPPPVTVLSPREQEVLRLLASGKRSIEIASDLGISSATVDVHRRNIRDKLGLNTVAELTRYAVREGLHSV
ncbi:MAG: response regulator transcription factor [Betaproteobacteria bacterium]|nr:response regulator transcription factor [Betaproteobacteria bacterium]